MSLHTVNQAVEDRYRTEIIQIFKKYLHGQKVALYLFGSRAKGAAHEASDIDLAVKGINVSAPSLARIREALHESHIPYKVDTVDWNKAGKILKNKIENEGILIWQN